jgi:lipoyl(octanoyl) transferase
MDILGKTGKARESQRSGGSCRVGGEDYRPATVRLLTLTNVPTDPQETLRDPAPLVRDAAVRDQAPASPLPGRWWFVQSPAADAAQNMAVDAAHLRRARRSGTGILRCYSWSAPAISFGRNERIRGRFDAADLDAAGLQAVRRPTGGRALLHVHEVTYSVALPIADEVSWRTAYDAINRLLCGAMQALGVDARIVPPEAGALMPPAAGLCFAAPSAGEIVVGNAKLVASAVWRERGGFLQQGSIITDGDQELLRRLARAGDSTPAPVATLGACGGPTDPARVALAIRGAFANTALVECWSPDDDLQRDIASCVHEFVEPSWLWRH